MPPQGAIVAVLALAGLASSFMFTLVVPIQTRLPDLLHANRDDTAWVVTATLLAAAVITAHRNPGWSAGLNPPDSSSARAM